MRGRKRGGIKHAEKALHKTVREALPCFQEGVAFVTK